MRVFFFSGNHRVFDILTYIRIAFWAVCSEGERTLRFWLLICQRKPHKVTDSMSRPPEFILWCELVGHSIVIQVMCFIIFGKSNLFLRFWIVRVLWLFGRVYTYLYFHIRIYINFNSWFRRCCFFWQCTWLDREVLNSIRKKCFHRSVLHWTEVLNSIKKRFLTAIVTSFSLFWAKAIAKPFALAIQTGASFFAILVGISGIPFSSSFSNGFL